MKISAIFGFYSLFSSNKPQAIRMKKDSGFVALHENNEKRAFYGRDLITKKNLSFGQTSSTNKEPADEEFETLRQKMNAKLQTLPENVSKKINTDKFTETNIYVADKILSDEKLYGNKGFMQKASKIIYTSKTEEVAKGRILILDKFLNDERVNSNTGFQKNLRDIVFETRSREGAKAKSEVLDKIFSEKKLLNDKYFMKNAPDIVKKNEQEIIEPDADTKKSYSELANEKLAELNKITNEINLTVLGDYNMHKGVIIPIDNDVLKIHDKYLIKTSDHKINGVKETVQMNIEKHETD